MKKTMILASILATLALLFNACGGGSSTDTNVEALKIPSKVEIIVEEN